MDGKSLFVRIKRWIFNALPEECLHFVCTTGRPSHGINSIGENCSHYVRTSLTLIFTTVVTQAKAKGKKKLWVKTSKTPNEEYAQLNRT